MSESMTTQWLSEPRVKATGASRSKPGASALEREQEAMEEDKEDQSRQPAVRDKDRDGKGEQPSPYGSPRGRTRSGSPRDPCAWRGWTTASKETDGYNGHRGRARSGPRMLKVHE